MHAIPRKIETTSRSAWLPKIPEDTTEQEHRRSLHREVIAEVAHIFDTLPKSHTPISHPYGPLALIQEGKTGEPLLVRPYPDGGPEGVGFFADNVYGENVFFHRITTDSKHRYFASYWEDSISPAIHQEITAEGPSYDQGLCEGALEAARDLLRTLREKELDKQVRSRGLTFTQPVLEKLEALFAEEEQKGILRQLEIFTKHFILGKHTAAQWIPLYTMHVSLPFQDIIAADSQEHLLEQHAPIILKVHDTLTAEGLKAQIRVMEWYSSTVSIGVEVAKADASKLLS